MPANPVQAGNALARGLRTEFVNTFRRQIKSVNERLSRVMTLGIPSDKLSEIYAYPESPMHPAVWPRGDDIADRPFRYVQFETENVSFSGKISWHADDEADDQTSSLVSQARDLASGFAMLPERVFFAFLTQAADPALPAIPLAADGAALFSNLDGAGAVRFGANNGNLLAGAGVATTAQIQTDFYAAISQFRLFQDTEGQPLHSDATLDSEVCIIYGSGNEQGFRQSFEQRTVQGNAAGLSNVILDSGLRVTLWSTSRITDNDWFVCLTGTETKGVFEQIRQPLRDNVEDFNNSDVTRRTKIRSYQADARMGYGISTPFQMIQINN